MEAIDSLGMSLVYCHAPVGGGPSIRGLQRITSTDPADGLYSKRLQKSAGELQLYFYLTHYRHFLLFLFKCLSLLTVLFLFLGASIVCVNNLWRTADYLVIPRQDICSCRILWFIEDFKALF